MVLLGESFNLSEKLFPHLENGRRKLGNIYVTCVEIKGKNQCISEQWVIRPTLCCCCDGNLSVDAHKW